MEEGVDSNLRGQHDERGADQDDHEQLARPDVGREVTVADSREGDDHVPQRVEQTELLQSAALQVLNAANTATSELEVATEITC